MGKGENITRKREKGEKVQLTERNPVGEKGKKKQRLTFYFYSNIFL